MSVLDYHAQSAPPELYKQHRVSVLFFLILHANIRRRCWPSVDRIVGKTSISRPTVIKALGWLRDCGAIEIIPFKLRVDEEKDLPPRLHVYQLTGVIQWDGETIRYLYSAPTPFNGDTHGKNSLLSIVKSVDSKESLPKLESDHNESSESTPSKKYLVSDETKTAFSILCYNNKTAWKTSAKAMSKALTTLCTAEDRTITVEDLRSFYKWWKTKDWRGKQNQLPEPYVVVNVWARFRSGEQSTPDTTLADAPKQTVVANGREIKRVKKES